MTYSTGEAYIGHLCLGGGDIGASCVVALPQNPWRGEKASEYIWRKLSSCQPRQIHGLDSNAGLCDETLGKRMCMTK